MKSHRNTIVAKIIKSGAKATQWDIIKEMKGQDRGMPEWVTANGLAKWFKELSWNYEPRGLPMPAWEDALHTTQFKFFEVEYSNEAMFYMNAKKLIRDGKGSDHAYSLDGVTLQTLKMFNEGWNTITDLITKTISNV